ncbi:ABC transporter permease [Frankia sp. CNm7]|uniref:ABC transporter permease n=1 Tax=Frankia nepalensis TaxID=1836974 RepID=A0A937UPJ6_9ACTN|nr:ABC transporter permease [Frankia nepalensis]MBL7502689.1 ABC transporter permease [Frankia nepalensis]MBL7515028.1 ABC transporter permease [Frankia nepalensis]MBL7518723.1 ABC transporter permease [Frankia nepalensis]MBL7629162.1 ABC transporter permease [Frankia nepalensis]
MAALARSLAGKAARAALVVVAVTVLTQWLLELAPGSVASVILGEAATPEEVARLDHEMGFDQPFLERYGRWLVNLLQGDLGTSPVTGQSVLGQIVDALPVTVELMVLGLSFGLLLTLVTGVLAARNPGGLADRVGTAMSSIALAVPAFVAGPVLAYLVAVRAGWLPVTGWSPISEGLGDNLRYALLPALCVGLLEFGILQRLLRADLVATMNEDFIDSARGRGVSESRLLLRHALRPASLPLLTITGLTVGRMLGGTVVVEALFRTPGLGMLLTTSISNRDLVTVSGIVALVAVGYVVINLAVDVAYVLVDPRIRIRAAS